MQDWSGTSLKHNEARRAAPALLLQFGMYPHKPRGYQGTQQDFDLIQRAAMAAKQEFLDEGFTEKELLQVINRVAELLPRREPNDTAVQDDKNFHSRANAKLKGQTVASKNITFEPSQPFLHMLIDAQLAMSVPGTVGSNPINRNRFSDTGDERDTARRTVPLTPTGAKD
jgi:hypothetical protein